MLVHSVYFWLRPGLSDEQRRQVGRGLGSLSAIPSEGCYVGTPVPSDRPVVEGSYTFGLTVLFESPEAMAAYMVHPVHQEFLAQFRSFWDRIVVYAHQ